MKKISKLLLAATSVLGFTIPYSGKAAHLSGSDNSESTQKNLVDQLLKNQIFKLDSQTQTLKIDEEKLLNTLRAEIKIKLANRNISADQEALYENLYENMKPGSFGSTNAGRYGTMDFNKGN